MSESEIKAIISKYRTRSFLGLFGFLSFAIAANYWLIQSGIEYRFELGLPQESTNTGFLSGTIIMGLNVVLWLAFYSFEKILLEIFKSRNDS